MDRIIVAAFVATFIAALAAVAGVPVLAQDTTAAPPAPPAAPDDPVAAQARVLAMDSDHDGRISRAEWLAAGRKPPGFDRIDSDHDGYLTMAEIDAGRARMRALRAARAPAQ